VEEEQTKLYFLMLEKVSEDKSRVVGVYYKPEQLSVAQKATSDSGTLIDSAILPLDAEPVRGQSAVLYLDSKTGTLAYEYEPRPLTQEELLEDVLAVQAGIVQSLADIMKRLEAIEGLLKVP